MIHALLSRWRRRRIIRNGSWRLDTSDFETLLEELRVRHAPYDWARNGDL